MLPKQFKLANDLILGSNSNSFFDDNNKDSLDVFQNKPFWCNNINVLEDNPTCCFNHIISLPVKNGIEHIIYDYELDVINKIENHRNVWIKKASGIGATELILRFLTWKILVNNDLEYKSIFIVSGTYVHHANELKVHHLGAISLLMINSLIPV